MFIFVALPVFISLIAAFPSLCYISLFHTEEWALYPGTDDLLLAFVVIHTCVEFAS